MIPRRARIGNEAAGAALAELLEAAALLLARMVWSAEALPMANRLAAALNRVTELAESPAAGAEDGRA